MTFDEARALAATLAPKSPGHLITAADWNALVSVLVDYGGALADLPDRMAAAEAAIAALGTRVDALDGLPARLQTLEEQTAPLRENYRLSVQTTAENFLVGQVAEIVFRASALDGTALVAPMPWLDVVATWGRLRAAPGFTVRDNAEENALSVQFNATGEVRVQLRSQFTRGFTPASEGAFANALKAQTSVAGTSVQQALATAASPQDPQAKLAFKALAVTYDANPSVRQYADAYVGQFTNGKFVSDRITDIIRLGEWEDYRATVMAFAKPDASALTPDPTRGIATVQVTFREWIAHWSDDYVHEVAPVLPGWRDLLEQNRQRPDILPFAVDQLDKRSRAEGALGNLRNLHAFDTAAGLVDPGGDAGLAQSKALLKGAAQLQLGVGGADAQAALGYAQQAQAAQQAGQTARAAQATALDAASTKTAVQVLEGRVKAAEQTGKEISAGLKNIGDGVNKINVAEVADLGGRLNKINLGLADLATRIPRG